MTPAIGSSINRARNAAGLSCTALASAAGISRRALSRIISGERSAKVPEIIAIARATGITLAQLTGQSTLSDRVQTTVRASGHSGVEGMREALLRYLELSDFLDDQAVPSQPDDFPEIYTRCRS